MPKVAIFPVFTKYQGMAIIVMPCAIPEMMLAIKSCVMACRFLILIIFTKIEKKYDFLAKKVVLHKKNRYKMFKSCNGEMKVYLLKILCSKNYSTMNFCATPSNLMR